MKPIERYEPQRTQRNNCIKKEKSTENTENKLGKLKNGEIGKWDNYFTVLLFLYFNRIRRI
jgi:hypothetical protein